jgi:hypothetical protein
MVIRLTWLLLPALGLAACSGSAPISPGADGGGASTLPVGGPVTSFAHVTAAGEILGVGAVVPVKSFENVPDFDPAFQGDIGIEMPAQVRDKTFIQLLRINWLSGGHGPSPYGAPHFDLHFYRGIRRRSMPSPAGIQARFLRRSSRAGT